MMSRDTPTPWHRLFGMALTDLFTGRPWRVELELELALKSQRLDVLIIERLTGQAATLDPAALQDLPDGVDTLGAHNILTYKSAQETLDAWAVDESIGHFRQRDDPHPRRPCAFPAAQPGGLAVALSSVARASTGAADDGRVDLSPPNLGHTT